MFPALELRLRLRVFLALLAAAIISAAVTPLVRRFCCRIGAMDAPGAARRIHDHPVPRLGGLAIYLGFLAGVLVFAPLSRPLRGILLGSVLIVGMGAADDLVSLKPWVKLLVQIAAAGIAMAYGVRIQILANPSAVHAEDIVLGALSVPVTLLWIVGVTNAMNLIDGVDGLAAGISGISCASTLAVSLFVPESTDASVMLGALGGACLGFLPFNRNPARIFMGDCGALLLGYILSTASVVGLFKTYAIVTCAVPLLTLALPITDTLFAIVRRLRRGESPLQADRGHIHHRLLALGMTQKQVVWLLYGVSIILGLAAVVMATRGVTRLWLLLAALIVAAAVWLYVFGRRGRTKKKEEVTPETPDDASSSQE